MLTVLRERTASKSSPPDSAAQTPAGTRGSGLARPDRSRDSTAGIRRVPPPSGANQPASAEPQTWTILAGEFEDVASASSRVDSLRRATRDQVPVRTTTVGRDPTRFRITVGRFDTEREAAAARARLRDALPPDAAIEPIEER
jgi:cell division septation protein DedD